MGEIKGKVEAIARENRKLANGKFERGLKIGADWYNLQNDKEDLLNKTISGLGRGDTVTIKTGTGNAKLIETIMVDEKAKLHEREDMENLESLLTEAHAQGLVKVTSTPVTIDTEKKIAIFKAVVTLIGKDGAERVFEAHGDAMLGEQGNMDNAHIRPHYIRMAETRALVRSLRWATGQSKAAEEEKA